MEKAIEKISEMLGVWVGNVLGWLLSAVFIWWGWSILAPHLNAPMFSFIEIFAIRMAVSSVSKIVWQKK